MGTVTLVLITACINLAGVLLARATARRREIAVRVAIGAGRAHLVRQLLTETLMLFVLGGAADLVLARLMTSLIVLALPPMPVPVDTSLPLDGRVMAFTAAVSLMAALFCGALPAMQASKTDVVSALKVDAPGISDSSRLRSAFVIAQIAFSLLLVISAGLLLRTRQRSSSIELGFDSRGVEVATLDLSLAGYVDTTGSAFVEQLLERLRTIPGVSGASAATLLPIGGRLRECCGVSVLGGGPPDGQALFHPDWNVVEPGYFGTLRIPMVAGREFTAHDRTGAVAIVSETAARQFWPGQNPIGRPLMWQKQNRLVARPAGPAASKGSTVVLTVVGVAGDIRRGGAEPSPLVYVPFRQQYRSDITIVARSSYGERLTREIRDLVASIDPNLPIVSSSRLADRSSPVLLQLRISAAVAPGVGIVALLLAAIGVYGVTAYAVTRRTREIGIRVAMGAQRRDVVGMVLRQGMSLVLVGGVIGLLLAAAAGRLLVGPLFGVPAFDPLTFGSAAVAFALVGLAACYVPVRRASRINAVEALRYE